MTLRLFHYCDTDELAERLAEMEAGPVPAASPEEGWVLVGEDIDADVLRSIPAMVSEEIPALVVRPESPASRSFIIITNMLQSLSRSGKEILPPALAASCLQLLGSYRTGAPPTLMLGNREVDLSHKTHVMGILNVTPDSFYDGGRYRDHDKAVERGLELAAQGADFIDVGGESSRPGAEPVGIEEELARVIPVIEQLHGATSVPLSIDTRKSEVAEAALKAGASVINDISGLRSDPRMAVLAAKSGAALILMHMKGTPGTMQSDPLGGDIMGAIYQGLASSMETALDAGVSRDRIILDPGIGFGKKRPDNFTIIRRLDELRGLGRPLLMGISRKSCLGWLLDLPEDERLVPSLAAAVASSVRGAQILRVHDVKETVQALCVADRISKRETG